MKKAAAFAGLVLLSACNTGSVLVGSGANAPIASPVQASSQSPVSGNAIPVADKVFFERVTVRNALPELTIAISFSSVDAQNSSPFGASLLGNQVFSQTPVFMPGKDDVTYLKSVDVDTDALMTTSLDSLQSKQLFGFPRPVVDFSLSADHSKVAWIDSNGLVSISDLGTGAIETLDNSLMGTGAQLTHIDWDSNASYILARADNGSALLYNTKKPTLLNGVTASSFSGDGKQLAYFNSSDRTLHFVNLATNQDIMQGVLESAEIHDLAWNSPSSVSYWTTLSSGPASGMKELRIFGSSQREITVATLTLPSAVGNGVVCPAWLDGKVYFGNYDSGKYVIEVASAFSDGNGVQIFVQTPDADLDEGFVCPKVSPRVMP